MTSRLPTGTLSAAELAASVSSRRQPAAYGNPPKVALFGIFGAGNLGNECTLRAMLDGVRQCLPTAKISCICSGTEATASTYNVAAFKIRNVELSPIRHKALRILRKLVAGVPVELYRWLKAIATLRKMDMLVMTGTGMLGDFGIGPFDLHYDILRWSIAARLCNCKLFFVSVGVGPILHPVSRRFVKAALALASYRSYRDAFSKDYLEGIGFDTSLDSVYPDLAFSLPRSIMPSANSRHGSGVVGIGLMTYHNRRSETDGDGSIYWEYVAKIAQLIVDLIEQKFTVRLLIGDVTYDECVRRHLKEYLEAKGVNYGANIIDEPAKTFDDVLAQLATTDIVVASRFHNVLLALMLAKPVVAISYHQKVTSLMRSVGLGDYCQDIEQVDVQTLIRQILALRDVEQTVRPQLEHMVEKYRAELDRQYDDIFVRSTDVARAV